MMSVADGAMSPGARLSQLARDKADASALIFISGDVGQIELSRGELDQASNRAARLLAARGLDADGMVLVALRNEPAHFIATYAGWKLGACVLPLNPSLPPREREMVLELVPGAVVVADWDEPATRLSSQESVSTDAWSDEPLPDRVPCPGKAIASGASTGRAKIILDPRPRAWLPAANGGDLGHAEGLRPGQTQLVPGPLYHEGPFFWSHLGLFEGQTLIVMDRFDAARVVELIERFQVNFACLVPTMMQRIARLPDIGLRDLSSIEAIFHAGSPCPAWLKHAWFDLIGPERLYEGYGSAENVGETTLRGDEWAAHPGSVGRASGGSDLRILDENGVELGPGVIGDVYMRPANGEATYRYLGAPPARTSQDGFVSVGDLGWVDEDGYLYLSERRADMIVSGGANVYPAEVEAVLSEHPDVDDVVVIGVPDDEWGRRVHAIVQPRDLNAPPHVETLRQYCRAQLAPFKLPKSFEFVETLPRSDTGKVQRGALAAERETGWRPAMPTDPDG